MSRFRPGKSKSKRKQRSTKKSDGFQGLQSLETRVLLSAVPTGVQFDALGMPLLNSNENAPVAIFLDFRYEATDGSRLLYNPSVDIDSNADPNVIDALEADLIYGQWAKVAANYAPFDINITTVEPDANTPFVYAGIYRTPTGPSFGGGAGSDGFMPHSEYLVRRYDPTGVGRPEDGIYPQSLIRSGSVYGGDVITHETGHSLFISGHEANDTEGNYIDFSDIPTVAGAFTRNTGPHGSWYNWYTEFTHKGNPNGFFFIQDDVEKIANRVVKDVQTWVDPNYTGDGFRPDDHGDAIAEATTMTWDAASSAFITDGVVERLNDTDVLSFDWAGGTVWVSALTSKSVSLLDARLTVKDASGAVVGVSDQNDSEQTALRLNDLAAGTYYVEVASDGDYSELGFYQVAVSTAEPQTFKRVTEIPMAGNSLADVSGKGHDGAWVGTEQWTTARDGSSTAAQFDGTNYIEVANPATSANQENFTEVNDNLMGRTFAFWFKADSTGGTQVLFEDPLNVEGRGYQIYLEDGQLKVYTHQPTHLSNWANPTVLTAPATINSGEWHHVAVTHQLSFSLNPDRVKLYLDGVEVASGEGAQTFKTDTFHIGSTSFAGAIDDVHILSDVPPTHIIAEWAENADMSQAAPAGPPVNTSATVTHDSTSLTWDAVGGATGYRVLRSEDGQNFQLITTVDAGTTSFDDTGLLGSHTYFYVVDAEGADGVGKTEVLTRAAPIRYAQYSKVYNPDPDDFWASKMDLWGHGVNGDYAIALQFFDSDGHRDTGVLIERSVDGVNFDNVITLPSTESIYYDNGENHNGLAHGATYTYRLTPVDDLGAVTSAAIILETDPLSLAPDTINDSFFATTVPTVLDVLANDFDREPGDSISITSATQGQHGTVTISPDGSSITYTYTGSGELTDTFTYTTTDGISESLPATVTINLQLPFGGTPADIASQPRLEAEDFDVSNQFSGEDLSYSDTNAINSGGANYRPGEDVDIEETTDTGGGYNITDIIDGEYLEYAVDLPGGFFNIHARVASADVSPGSIRVLFGDNADDPQGADFTEVGTFSVPTTGGDQAWTTVTLGNINLSDYQQAGKVMRLEMIGGNFNLNWVEFEQVNSAPTVVNPIADVTLDEDQGNTLKVFLLAGQSNMEGQAFTFEAAKFGNVPTMEFLLSGTPAANTYLSNLSASGFYGFVPNFDSTWFDPRNDVWGVQYDSGNGALRTVIPTLDPADNLTGIQPIQPGFGVNTNNFSMIGPELGMAHRLGEASDSPVMLFKSNLGGTTLAEDWRSPDAVLNRGGAVGVNYTNTIDNFVSFLDTLDADLADDGVLNTYGGVTGYEVAGIYWLQGFNDQVGGGSDARIAEYADNLVDLVHSIRDEDTRIPDNLGVIVGESSDQNPEMNVKRQEAVDRLNAEIPGSASFYFTDGMHNVSYGTNDAGEEFTTGGGFHYHSRAESYIEIGWKAGSEALANGMIETGNGENKVDISSVFSDADTPLTYSVTGNSSPLVVELATLNGTELTLYLVDDAHGTSDITVRATDAVGAWTEETFTVIVNPVQDKPEGNVAIDGFANVNQVLAVDTSGIVDVDGMTGASFSYQWQHDTGSGFVDIAGETGTTYTLTQDDFGDTLRVIATYTDDGGTVETLTSAATLPVAPPNEPVTGSVVITGTSTRGKVLTADASGLADADGLGPFSYQWQRETPAGFVDIAGATATTYTLVADDVNTNVRMVVTFVDGNGTGETVLSPEVAVTDGVVVDNPIGDIFVTMNGPDTVIDLIEHFDPPAETFDSPFFHMKLDAPFGSNSTYLESSTGLNVPFEVGSVAEGRPGLAPDGGTAIEFSNDATPGYIDAGTFFTSQGGQYLPGSTNNTDPSATVSTSTYTISTWVSLPADGSGGGVIAAGADGRGGEWALSISNASKRLTVNWNGRSFTPSFTIPDDEAVLLVIQGDGSKPFNGNKNRVGMWRDGIGWTWETSDEGKNLRLVGIEIGSRFNGGSQFVGTIDDFRLYHGDVLSDSDLDFIAAPLQYTIVDSTNPALVGTSLDRSKLSLSYLADQFGTADITVRATHLLSGEFAEATFTVDVRESNNAPTGSVILTGTQTEDQALTADTSGIADADGLGTFSYQWQRDIGGGFTDVAGETASTYTLGDLDVGGTVRLVVSYVDGTGFPHTLISTPTAPIANVNDPVTGSVVINGTLIEDQVLTANASGLVDIDGLGTFSYQWQRDTGSGFTDITGETASTYTLDDPDVGATIRVVVSYVDGGGANESIASAATTPIVSANDPATGSVVLIGTPEEDQSLAADTSGLADIDGLGAFSYLWQRDTGNGGFTTIAGETASAYTLGDSDVGARIRAIVSYLDGQGTIESVVSEPTTPVQNVNDAPSVAAGIANVTVDENAPDTVIDLSNVFTDIEDASIVNVAVTDNTNPGLVGTVISGTSLTLSYIINAFGTADITVRGIDSDGLFVEDTFTVTVNDVPGEIPNPNTTPTVAGPISDVTVDEDAGATVLDLSSLFTDVEDGALTNLVVSNNTNPVVVGTSLVGTSLTLSYVSNASGTADITVRGTDTNGAWVEDTFTVTVNAVQDTPTVTPFNDLLVAENAGDTVIDLFSLFADAEDGVITNFTLTGNTNIGLVDASVVGTNLTLSYTADTLGSADITVRGTDSTGLFVEDTFTVTVSDEIGVATKLTNGVVTVDSGVWNTITLEQPYVSMVVVATVVLPDNTHPPIVSRINNASGLSFDLMVQRLDNQTGTLSGIQVHYMVIEEGVYTQAEHGINAEAVKVNSAVTDGDPGIPDTDWVGQVATYQNNYSNPVVVGQVMTYNNTRHSIFWTKGATRQTPPSSTDLVIGKHIGQDFVDPARVDETLGYIVLEAGVGVLDGKMLRAGVTSDSIKGVDNDNGSFYNYGISGLTDPVSAVLSVAGVDAHGGYNASLAGSTPLTTSQLTLVADEDQLLSPERNHDTEQLAFVVFDNNIVPSVTSPIADVVVGEDASNTVIDLSGVFTDIEDGAITNLTIADNTNAGLVGTSLVGTSLTLSYTADAFGTTDITVRGTDLGGLFAEDIFTVTVNAVNDPVTGSVLITGTAAEDQTLTADTSGLSDADGLGAFSYQWQRDTGGGFTDIAGAIASTYTLGDSDVDATVRVIVSYTDGIGTNESVTSAATAPVINVNDPVTGSVVITGTATEDQTLTTDASGLVDADGLGALGYQWQRDTGGGFADIAGATSSTYTLGDGDVGATIRVVVSYTDGQGTNESVASAATATVTNVNDTPTGTVQITGTVTEGQTLTADTSGLIDEDGLGTFDYQWQRDTGGGFADIAGATSSTYTLGSIDAGTTVRVVVSYVDGQGTPESVVSAAPAPVNSPATGSVLITGTATEDQTLTADASHLADPNGLGAFSYQWQRDTGGGFADIAGATATTYTLGDSDVGATVRVIVSYTDGIGTNESVASAATALVANVNDFPAGSVVISGAAEIDAVLTVDASGLADADGLGAFSYQWQRDFLGGGFADIAGETTSTYVPVVGDTGATLRVIVSYTDGQGTAESVASTPVLVAGDGVVVLSPINDIEVDVNDPDTVIDLASVFDPASDSSPIFHMALDESDGSSGYLEGVSGLSVATEVGSVTEGVAGVNPNDAGTAIEFLASGNYIDAGTIKSDGSLVAGNDTDPLFLSNYTVSAWITLPDTHTSAGKSIIKSTHWDPKHAWSVAIEDFSGVENNVRVGFGSSPFVSNIGLEDGGTYLIVLQRASNTPFNGNRARVGVWDGTDWTWAESNPSPSRTMYLRAMTIGDGFGGVVDDVKIFDEVVSDADLNAMAEALTFTVESNTNPSVVGTSLSGDQLTLDYLPDQSGTAQITIQASNSLGFARDTFTVGVGANSNTAPTVASPIVDVTVDEDAADSVIDLSGLFTDAEDGAITNLTVTGNTNVGLVGTSLVGTSLTLSYTADASGTADITVRGTDSGGLFVEDTFTVTVNAVNDTPSVASAIADVTVDEDSADTVIDLSGVFTDVEDGTITNLTVTDNTDATLADTSLVGTSLTLSYTADRSGTTDITVRGTDSGGLFVEDTFTVTVSAVNDEPAGSVLLTGTATEDQTLTADASGLADADGLGTFGYQWQRDTGSGFADIAGATATTYTLGDSDVDATIRVVVSYTDGGGTAESVASAATAPVTNVNDTPTVTSPIADVTVDEDAPDTVIDLSAVFTDVEDGALTNLTVTGNTNTGLVGTSLVGTNLTLNHAADASGTSDITVRGTDSGGLFVENTFTVTVTAVNDTPTLATTIADVTVNENASDTVIDLSAVFADIEDGAITNLTVTGNTNAGLVGTSLVGTDLTLSYTADTFGTAGITVRGTDSGGLFVEDTFTVTVNQVVASGSPKLFSDIVTIDSGVWNTINLSQSYNSMVVVATIVLPDSSQPPMATRIGNASGSSFDLMLQRLDGQTGTISGVQVHYMVIEEGVYTQAEHGVNAEAVKVTSTVTDGDPGIPGVDWVGQAAAYQNSYSSPVVVGQVMSYNDTGHSIFWAQGASRTAAPSSSDLVIGKHIGQDFANPTRADETLGYIVFENGTHTVEGWTFRAGLTADIVRGVGNGSYTTGFGSGLSNATSAVLSAAGIDGGEGVDPVLVGATPVGATQLTMAVEEDQLLDNERKHTPEQIAYVVFDADPNSSNTAPTVATPTADVTVDEDATDTVLDLSGAFTDIEDGAITNLTVTGNTNIGLVSASLVGTSLTLSYAANASGTADITVRGMDSGGLFLEDTFTVTVNAVNDPVTGSVVIAGTAQEGQTLTADTNGLSDADGLGVFGYQWQRDTGGGFADIAGATASTFQLTSADAGSTVRVVVSYTDGGGTAESVISAATSTVTAAITANPIFHMALDESDGSSGYLENVSGLSVATEVGSMTEGQAALAPDGGNAIGFGIDSPANYIHAGTIQSDGTLVAGSDADFMVLDNYTVSAWVAPSANASGGSDRVILSSDWSSDTGWMLALRDAGVENRIVFDFGSTRFTTNLAIPDGQSALVVAQRDTSNPFDGNSARIGVWDGVSWTWENRSASTSIRMQGLEIGSFGGVRQFDGAIDDVRIFDQAVSDADLNTLAGTTASQQALAGGSGSSPQLFAAQMFLASQPSSATSSNSVFSLFQLDEDNEEETNFDGLS